MNKFFEWINSITPQYCPTCKVNCCSKFALDLEGKEELPFIELGIPLIHKDDLDLDLDDEKSHKLIWEEEWTETREEIFTLDKKKVPLTVLIQMRPDKYTFSYDNMTAKYILFKKNHCPVYSDKGSTLLNKKPSVCQEYPLRLNYAIWIAKDCPISQDENVYLHFFQTFPNESINIPISVAKKLGLKTKII